MVPTVIVYAAVVSLLIAAMTLGTAARGILLQYTGPVFCALFAWIFQRRRIGKHTAVALLVAAIDLIADVRHTMGADSGFSRGQVIFARVRPAITRYMRDTDDVAARMRDYVTAIDRLRALPDVRLAAYGAQLFEASPGLDGSTAITVDGKRGSVAMTLLEVRARVVGHARRGRGTGEASITWGAAGFRPSRDYRGQLGDDSRDT
jgi:hypothetical protein